MFWFCECVKRFVRLIPFRKLELNWNLCGLVLCFPPAWPGKLARCGVHFLENYLNYECSCVVCPSLCCSAGLVGMGKFFFCFFFLSRCGSTTCVLGRDLCCVARVGVGLCCSGGTRCVTCCWLIGCCNGVVRVGGDWRPRVLQV